MPIDSFVDNRIEHPSFGNTLPLTKTATATLKTSQDGRFVIKRCMQYPLRGPLSLAAATAEIAAAIRVPRHDNVVAYHGAWQEGGHVSLFMDHAGESLSDWMQCSRISAMPLAQYRRVLAGIMSQVVVGVQHMHNSGFVHLDLKPDNIMIAASSRLCSLPTPVTAASLLSVSSPSALASSSARPSTFANSSPAILPDATCSTHDGRASCSPECKTKPSDAKSTVVEEAENKEWLVRIGDLGMVRLIAELEARTSEAFDGTKEYLAPEMLQGAVAVDDWQAVDVFALGCSFYQLWNRIPRSSLRTGNNGQSASTAHCNML